MGWVIVSTIGLPAWIALALVFSLVLFRINWRTDVPLFIAGYALGYWGEWWGTTHGVWTYWNGQTPPDYLPPLWAIGLITVWHLSLLPSASRIPSIAVSRQFKALGMVTVPMLAFAYSAPRLQVVDWNGILDLHFVAGVIVGITLIIYRVDIDESFRLFVCGMLLGGTYELLGTSMHEWTYVTREVPPIWIIPLWGLACVAMVKLSRLLSRCALGAGATGRACL